MAYDREYFFDSVRSSLFGNLTQQQVNGMNYLLDVWEEHFAGIDTLSDVNARQWLSYALATAFHETAQKMQPIEEYGEGSGHDYGKPAGPYDQCYYGRGYVQLTWLTNYQKGEQILADNYGVECPMVEYPHRMCEAYPAALVLFDGMINGWFTGVGLPDFFNANREDPYEARTIVNGHDKASTIEGYYWKFKNALKEEEVI